MKIKRYLEIADSSTFEPLTSFYIKDELNPKVWGGEEINQEVREQLLKIAQDFYDGVELEAEPEPLLLIAIL